MRRRPRPMTRLMRKRQFVPSLRDRRDNPFCEDRQLRDMEDRAVRSHFLHDYGDSLPGPPRKLNEFRRQPAGASPKKRPLPTFGHRPGTAQRHYDALSMSLTHDTPTPMSHSGDLLDSATLRALLTTPARRDRGTPKAGSTRGGSRQGGGRSRQGGGGSQQGGGGAESGSRQGRRSRRGERGGASPFSAASQPGAGPTPALPGQGRPDPFENDVEVEAARGVVLKNLSMYHKAAKSPSCADVDALSARARYAATKSVPQGGVFDGPRETLAEAWPFGRGQNNSPSRGMSRGMSPGMSRGRSRGASPGMSQSMSRGSMRSRNMPSRAGSPAMSTMSSSQRRGPSGRAGGMGATPLGGAARGSTAPLISRSNREKISHFAKLAGGARLTSPFATERHENDMAMLASLDRRIMEPPGRGTQGKRQYLGAMKGRAVHSKSPRGDTDARSCYAQSLRYQRDLIHGVEPAMGTHEYSRPSVAQGPTSLDIHDARMAISRDDSDYPSDYPSEYSAPSPVIRAPRTLERRIDADRPGTTPADRPGTPAAPLPPLAPVSFSNAAEGGWAAENEDTMNEDVYALASRQPLMQDDHDAELARVEDAALADKQRAQLERFNEARREQREIAKKQQQEAEEKRAQEELVAEQQREKDAGKVRSGESPGDFVARTKRQAISGATHAASISRQASQRRRSCAQWKTDVGKAEAALAKKQRAAKTTAKNLNEKDAAVRRARTYRHFCTSNTCNTLPP